MTTMHEQGSSTIDAPQALLGNHPKALKLPAFAREYEKVALESRHRIALIIRAICSACVSWSGLIASDIMSNAASVSKDPIARPFHIVFKAAEEFREKTTAPSQLWKTDFAYLKIVGWDWYYQSKVLYDFFRSIVARKLCATMKTEEVSKSFDQTLNKSGLDRVNVAHRP